MWISGWLPAWWMRKRIRITEAVINVLVLLFLFFTLPGGGASTQVDCNARFGGVEKLTTSQLPRLSIVMYTFHARLLSHNTNPSAILSANLLPTLPLTAECSISVL